MSRLLMSYEHTCNLSTRQSAAIDLGVGTVLQACRLASHLQRNVHAIALDVDRGPGE